MKCYNTIFTHKSPAFAGLFRQTDLPEYIQASIFLLIFSFIKP